MIALETFAEIIQSGLNSNNLGLSYKIFADASEYKKAKKTRTEKVRYTNGLLRIGTSSIIPTKGVVVATQGAQLELVVALPSPETDEAVIKTHRTVLDTYFSAYAVQKFSQGEKSYTVSSTYSLADTGTVEMRDGIGTSITFYVDISYAYIENGLNSDDVEYELDGYEIPYTSVQYRKFSTTDSNASSGATGVSYSRNSAFMRGFDFEMPALSSVPISDLVISYMDNNDMNTVHTLTKKVGAVSKTFNVIFGEVSMSVQGVNNVGLKFSLVERASYVGDENG